MDFELEKAMQVLERTPATLEAMLGGLDESWVRATEGPATFSPFDVVGHLIEGEDNDWIARARVILARGPDPRFEPFDRFRHQGRTAGKTMASLLDEFGRLRAANLETLRGWQLSSADLDLPGIHPALGPVTMRQLLATWVAHDLGHIAQAARVMAKQYRDGVGPWVAYLPVLTDRPVPQS